MTCEEAVTLTAQDGVKVEATLHYDNSLPLRTALTIMHPTADWRHHYVLKHLAERGLGALGFTTRYTGREADLILEDTILDTAAGIEFLRSRGYSRVVGIGNSGGGEIIAVYQSQVEHPTITGTPLGDPPNLSRAKLPPMDGLIFLNSHKGRPLSITRGLDPSVGGEDGNNPLRYDSSLDMYNPQNGPPYSQVFQERYQAAQVERNYKITRWCQRKLSELKHVGNPLLKDFPFIVHRTDANLNYLDTGIDPSDRSGRTIWDEDPRITNYTVGPLRGRSTRLRVFTARSWLSQRGLATSQFDVMRHLHRCHIPVLVICGTAEASGPRASQDIFAAAPDLEKKLEWISGGTHFMTGQEDKQAEVASTIAQWIQDRGLG